MHPFPTVDPIPLPAPIWLIKLLHIVTLSLHFVAVEMLLGGLLLAVLFSLFASSPHSQLAARAIARRLTVVMTYVINLGVPPLLFAQVLYGRALYTSSVLIGIYWIAVVGVLTVTYWLLYQFSGRLEQGKSAWWVGLLAWLGAGSIAKILSTNMTLMLRPEAWQALYSASAAGRFLPQGDPTTNPRFTLMLVGGLFVGGLWLVYLSARSTFLADEQKFLAGVGGKIAAVAGLGYLAAGYWANSVQPTEVLARLHTEPLYRTMALAGYGWLALAALGVLLGAVVGLGRIVSNLVAWTGAVLVLLIEICLVVYRDAIRDVTLLTKGFNVWDRVVATNWSVVILFLVLFVAGLGVIGWLVSVVARAEKTMEGAA